MLIPDPTLYHDGIIYLRDLHKTILKNCAALEPLLLDAEQVGVFPSFVAHKEWSDLLTFFTKACPHHEKDEERFLFPLVLDKLPHVGFQQPDSSIRFLIEGHELLESKMVPLITVWQAYRTHYQDEASSKRAAAAHAKEYAEFIAHARELIELYRKHIAIEEERVYKVAEQLFSPTERHLLMKQLRDEYDNEATTRPPSFDPPQFSNPQYNVHYVVTDAQGDRSVESDSDEEPDTEY